MTAARPIVLVALLAILPIGPNVDGAKILGVWPMPAPSHFFLGGRLFKELAARGHEVTMISSFPQKSPLKNYRDVALVGMHEALFKSMPNIGKIDMYEMGNIVPWKQALFTAFAGSAATDATLDNESVQKLLRNKEETFDLIIFEMFHSEVLFGMAHHFNCPVIVLSTMGSSLWTNHLVGNPAPSTYVPDLFMKFSSRMSFVERIYNTLHLLLLSIERQLMYFPKINERMHKYFPTAPHISELMYNKTALVLLNSHPSISDPTPHVPAMVEVGGFHIDAPKALPKELKEWMDNAKDGVILFSMGSNLKSSELSDEKRTAILSTFSKLKQQVIWKWEDEHLPGKPANVKIMKWCPQNDIMAHPNLKLFVTHGGLLSTTEAVYHGVPVVGIPIFGDQKMNVARTTRLGYGIAVHYEELTEGTLSNAINEVLHDRKYRDNAKLRASILHDQPVKPIDNAVFWTEYVIRHKGAEHLRSAALNLDWYQLYSIDMAVTLVAAILLFALLFYAALSFICDQVCGKKTAIKQQQKTDANKDHKKKKH